MAGMTLGVRAGKMKRAGWKRKAPPLASLAVAHLQESSERRGTVSLKPGTGTPSLPGGARPARRGIDPGGRRPESGGVVTRRGRPEIVRHGSVRVSFRAEVEETLAVAGNVIESQIIPGTYPKGSGLIDVFIVPPESDTHIQNIILSWFEGRRHEL